MTHWRWGSVEFSVNLSHILAVMSGPLQKGFLINGKKYFQSLTPAVSIYTAPHYLIEVVRGWQGEVSSISGLIQAPHVKRLSLACPCPPSLVSLI